MSVSVHVPACSTAQPLKSLAVNHKQE